MLSVFALLFNSIINMNEVVVLHVVWAILTQDKLVIIIFKIRESVNRVIFGAYNFVGFVFSYHFYTQILFQRVPTKHINRVIQIDHLVFNKVVSRSFVQNIIHFIEVFDSFVLFPHGCVSNICYWLHHIWVLYLCNFWISFLGWFWMLFCFDFVDVVIDIFIIYHDINAWSSSREL